MPTYEFRCPDGHDFEKFYRSISGAESQAACPVCEKLSGRIMSPAGFAFKGSGFYLTDYGKNAHREKGTGDAKSVSASKEAASASGSESAAAKSDAAPAPSSDSAKSESKSESKGEAKSEAKSEVKAKAAEPKPAAPSKPSKSE